jgi:DNA-binding LacI/PurR family transcriptional regulator
VVGFDDDRHARFFEPPLTTVCQDFNALAKQSVEYLIEMIENKNTPIHQRVLYPELVVRESTSIAQTAI